MPVVRCKEAASGTLTRALVPLNDSALPYLPAVDQVAAVIVPALLFPEASATVVPEPSLKAYAATRAGAVRSSSVSSWGLDFRGTGRRYGRRAPGRTILCSHFASIRTPFGEIRGGRP